MSCKFGRKEAFSQKVFIEVAGQFENSESKSCQVELVETGYYN